jgi:hypothetical protein
VFETLPIVIAVSAIAAGFVALTALNLMHRVRIRRHLHRLESVPFEQE